MKNLLELLRHQKFIATREHLAICSEDAELLDLLSKDPKWEVRIAVVRNKSTHLYTLKKMVNDQIPYVSQQAKVWLSERLKEEPRNGL